MQVGQVVVEGPWSKRKELGSQMNKKNLRFSHRHSN